MAAMKCVLCGLESPLIAETIGFCVNCIRREPQKALPRLKAVHAAARREFDLPPAPPEAAEGVRCRLCTNECAIPEGERGFCGLSENRGGRLQHLAGTPGKGLLYWYYDPLPTNCVAAWVCPGSAMRGFKNLAVFYGSCTFNCRFCQNWHFREMNPRSNGMSAQELAGCADGRTYCICYFGGDPASQMPHALATSRILADRGVRICWETNGSMHPELLEQAVELSLASGGCIKFDLKAYDENLHRALTGVSNKRTLANFARAAKYVEERPEPPLVVAGTLLVPGYIDAQEVGRLAAFIAGLNPSIPYSLLAFHPHFYLPDLPRTSVGHAHEALSAAQRAGLSRVHIGNLALLSRAY